MRVLNIGCRTINAGTVNLDIEKQGVPNFILGDIRDLPKVWNEHFDVVMAFHVIEHLYPNEVVNAIKECVRVLKRGGLLWIKVPYRNNIIRSMVGHNNPDHKCSFTKGWFNRFFGGRARVNYDESFLIPLEIDVRWWK